MQTAFCKYFIMTKKTKQKTALKIRKGITTTNRKEVVSISNTFLIA